jgi:[ribosomal protein S18]-alanine N-acetyltransferase
MADVTIRLAALRDLDTVHKIEVESFPVPWRREFFASELDASGRYAIVAVRGGKVIGYVFAMWIFDEMHINKIAVTTHERRKGIADLLMDRCFEFAKQTGVTLMSLEVRKSNAGAQEFYKRRGFEAAYVRPRYYPDGEAAVVMSSAIPGSR